MTVSTQQRIPLDHRSTPGRVGALLGFVGMACEGNDTLNQYEPIVQGLIEVGLEETGWAVLVRHRHSTGRLSQCLAEAYDSLTLAEALDVICASLSGWGLSEP